MNIYIVEAQFQTYDTYYEQIVGVFDDLKIAEYNKNKWIDFFKSKNEEIFGSFKDESIRDEDGDFISFEVEDDFYIKKYRYKLIFDFQDITIRNLKINEDWIKMGYLEKNEEFDLMKQFSIEYNREYNINNLID